MMARPATPPITPPTMAPVSAAACQLWSLHRHRLYSLVPLPDLPASVTAPVAIDDDVTRMDPFESVTVTTLYHGMSMMVELRGLLHSHNTGRML